MDTHGRTHHAAALDGTGRILGDREFLATGAGYLELVRWLADFGEIVKVGVEGTGSYRAGLARLLTDQVVTAVEVDRPDRRFDGRGLETERDSVTAPVPDPTNLRT